MAACPACQEELPEEAKFCGRCGTGLALHNRIDPFLGQVISQRYRVLSLIAEGGMGNVYRVEHLAIGKIAAMKVMRSDVSARGEGIKRFRREAEVVSRLAHPHIVQVFDFGEWQGAMYIVMEFVRGEDLSTVLGHEERLPLPRAVTILCQVCEALTEAHDLGIIHRDLKPENILITRTRSGGDFVKVVDFGLAKIRERTGLGQTTAHGVLIGTPSYMAPEQIRTPTSPDLRTDVYALGAVLYQMLSGDPPFEAPSPVGILTKHLTEMPMPLHERVPGLPRSVDAVVSRALDKDPNRRFQSMAELRQALEGLTTAPPVAATPPVAPIDSDRPAIDVSEKLNLRLSRADFDAFEQRFHRQRRLRLALLPALLLALVGVSIGLVRRFQEGPVEVEPNDDPAHANVLTSFQSVRGKIGKRISREEGDRDVYRIPEATDGRSRLLRVTVTGLSNLNLLIQVHRSDGTILAIADKAPAGAAESLENLLVDPRDAYIVVRQVRQAGDTPIENVSDEYVLEASWQPIQDGR